MQYESGVKMNRVVVIDAKRSPMGSIPGELNGVEETLLLSKVFEALKRTWQKIEVDEAVTGSSFPLERDNLCRKALQLVKGLESIPAYTICKTCASSDEALRDAYFKVKAGGAEAILVGGCEKISNSSYVLCYMKRNVKGVVKGKLPHFSDIENAIQENDMAYINEMLSRRYEITRKQQDDFALESIYKARLAEQRGLFKEEITPIEYEVQGQQYRLDEDSCLRVARKEAMVRESPPFFLADGVLTQYNAAPMCDCAAAVLVAKKAYAVKKGVNIYVEVVDSVSIGVSKIKKGEAMAACIWELLKRNGLQVSDIDLFEVNESFASQAICTRQQLGIHGDRMNVNGGNLALGYPIGATGLRMSISLIYEMLRRKARYGVSVMCAGGCMAIATLFENAFPTEERLGVQC